MNKYEELKEAIKTLEDVYKMCVDCLTIIEESLAKIKEIKK